MDNYQQQERIESLRRKIQNKKYDLCIDSDILYLKSLKKFNNIEGLKYPKSVTNNYYINSQKDIKGRFFNICTKSYKDAQIYIYVFDKIKEEISKYIYSEISDLIDDNTTYEESINIVDKYIVDKTNISSLELSLITDEKTQDFCTVVMKEREKTQSNKFVQLFNRRYESEENFYTSYDVRMKKTVGNHYFGKNKYKGQSGRFLSLFDIIATSIILEIVNNYFFNNIDNFNFIKNKLSEKMEIYTKFFEEISPELFFDIFEENNYMIPTFLKSIIVLVMEEILKDSFEISQYEERLKVISGNYATTYMTKKNIPKKILSFMDNNNFLNMFGFIEADADCDLEKIKTLANEFKHLSTLLYLPKVKNHSLRFRKLGKLKASGVYYPGYNTLAVDLDGVSSFIHEMFHMIDFTNNILSFDMKFKPLLDKYRELLDLAVNELGEDHETYISWYKGKGKYSRQYYISNEEAFARMGELYVTDILKVNSSFTQLDYTKSNIEEIVYPKNQELLDMIKIYYDNVFENLEKTFEQVLFDDSNINHKSMDVINKKNTTTEYLDEKDFDINLNSNINIIEQVSFF